MDEQTQVIALMAIALADARAQIQADRDSLYESVVQADGTVDPKDELPLDEYTRVIDQINTALTAATGGRV